MAKLSKIEVKNNYTIEYGLRSYEVHIHELAEYPGSDCGFRDYVATHILYDSDSYYDAEYPVGELIERIEGVDSNCEMKQWLLDQLQAVDENANIAFR